jgi:hypothetical protein
MPDATYAISSFLGGEISQFAQGRFDKPDYRISLNVCVNAFPAEIGPWVRRPGTMFAGTTRGGAAGRVVRFDFEQNNPYTIELVNGFMRFRSGASIATTNDSQVVTSVSAATPAVVTLPAASTWLTGNTLIFSAPSTPLLENRQFVATRIDSQHFSLADAITGAAIVGASLGPLASGATVSRVQELTTPYITGLWANVRAVQAETNSLLLEGSIAPQILTVASEPTSTTFAEFDLSSAVFIDGPYLDPFTNGVQAEPSAASGIIDLTIAFAQFSSTTAYAVGSFVTSAGINYVSIADQNVGNTPASSPTFWATTPAGAAIGPNGFVGTDIGRLVRLFSEPTLWEAGSTFAMNEVVSYNPSGMPGAAVYYQSLVSDNVGFPPGADLIHWEIVPQGAAIYTYGKIVGLSNVIDRELSGAVPIGNMTQDGGVSAPFNGDFTQAATASAQLTESGSTAVPTQVALASFVGTNFSGASPQVIQQATVFPSSDEGFSFGSEVVGGVQIDTFTPSVILSLFGSQTAPTSSANGTLLGTTGVLANSNAAVTIISTNQTTAWNFVWIQIEVFASVGPPEPRETLTWFLSCIIGQISFFNPTGTGTGSGVQVEILGPALLYVAPILTWQLGAFSATTGFPTCGCYDDGRIWLGGAIANRFDASVSNGISGNTINFAPTDEFGDVAASNSISETLDADGVNQITWMEPDLQGIIMGTQACEFLVLAPTSGSIAPTNITSRRVTRIGAADVPPMRTEHTIVFVQRYAIKLMEYFADVFSGKFSAPNLADKAQHITRNGIMELAYQSAAAPILWARDTIGNLFGLTYKRDTLTTSQGPTFYAWHRHALGSGRIVESVCVGPSIGGNLDTLTMVTDTSPAGVRHVEILTDTQDELSALADAFFLDDAITPTSTSSTLTPSAGAPYGGLTINGLWNQNGNTVQVFAGGLDCGDIGLGPASFTDFVVNNGSIFVPYGDTISAGPGRGLFTAEFAATVPIVVGFTYTSQGQLVRPIMPADTGARNGPALGKIRRNHRYAALVSNTLGMSFGTNFNFLLPVSYTLADQITPIAPLVTFSGVHEAQPIDQESYDGMLCWQVSRPWPANLVAVSGNIATQDQ